MESVLTFLTLLAGFYMAWNIGANDVANAMGTSVGSKALTLRRAVLLAAFLEFSGALFVGDHVSATIQHGIVRPEVFASQPMYFLYGMLGSLIATGVLLQIASWLALPVSTTHAIVGAVFGFGLALGGSQAIEWAAMGRICLSWVLSPVLSGAAAYGLFFWIERGIFRARNPILATQRLAPFFVFCCFSLVIWSFASDFLNASLWVSATLSCSCGAIASLTSIRLLQTAPLSAGGANLSSSFGVEKIFAGLQILSACLVAFAHGANDVANAIGPVSAALQILNKGSFNSEAHTPVWLLALGGGGIILGLATWGWRVIETIGKKITELTPSRGFSAEFGAAATILIASKLGLPVSTTHALVGAVLGVGLVRGMKALNLGTLKEIAISWVITIPLCALLSIGAFYLLRSIFG